MRVGIVVPHIFMHEGILPDVIFSPGNLAIDLADRLQAMGADVTLFTPGPIKTGAHNITADLSFFDEELNRRGDTYIELLKKHPFTFITLARQVQSEIMAKAFEMANGGELDVIHVYANEEDTALHFAKLCNVPVLFTHHDPFNFLVKYKSVMPKYKNLNWLSLSLSQRAGMPEDTNWVGNIYHGLSSNAFKPVDKPTGGYIAYLGRIIEPKGVHLAIAAVKTYNQTNPGKLLKLKIAGKHYSDTKKDSYWQNVIKPEIDGRAIIYEGFIGNSKDKELFLSNADALVIPSTFNEPFGMVMIEALACGTPIIGLNSGAIPEIVKINETGFLVEKSLDESETVANLGIALSRIQFINRKNCRQDFEQRFTLDRMCQEHLAIYKKLAALHRN